VFLVNSENPIRNLTTAQIRAIYGGQILDWSQVGSKPDRMQPLRREENSGSEELMRSLVMRDVPFGDKQGRSMIGFGMIGIFLELTQSRNGLGYSVYYYERFMSGSPRTRVIAVDGVEPTYETIRDRKYPYTSDVLVVTRKGPDTNAPALRLRDWLRSPEGQAVVRESGYVPSTSRER
jgi:phosphate transport system substrate-binding protein